MGGGFIAVTKPALNLDGYHRHGSGEGGAPVGVGSEYLLLTRHKDGKAAHNKRAKNGKVVVNKDELIGYVVVEIKTK